jgi:flagellar P-ring protein precursor FlgI
MYNHLLLSLALLMGPTPLQQNSSEVSAATGTDTQEPTADVTPNLWTGFGGGIEAPTQPTFRSDANISRTRRIAAPQMPTSIRQTKAPVGTLVSVRGLEDNHVMGIGLVTGLAGTGDSGSAARQLLKNLLLTRNINVDLQGLSSKNIAVVRVEGVIPAGLRPGQPIDVRASTIGDAISLDGGTLVMTELTDITGRFVYATASGPVTTGGYSAEGDAASVRRNHPTVATLPSGGKVEREVQTSIVSDHGFLFLDLRTAHDSLGNAVRVAEVANAMYPGVAQVSVDGKSVRVRVPADIPHYEYAAFTDSILGREVVAHNVPRIIINERTGLIAMGGDVRLKPGVITHGSLTVTIAESEVAFQPGGESNGETVTAARTDLDVVEEDNPLMFTNGATTLQEVVEVLNILGATPRDMITILQGMAQNGTLLAEIKRM